MNQRTELIIYRGNILSSTKILSTEWTATADWIIADGTATHISGAGSGTISVLDVIKPNRTYRIYIGVTGQTAGQVQLAIGFTATYQINNDGHYGIDLQATGADNTDIYFYASNLFDGTINYFYITESPESFAVDLYTDVPIPITYSISDIKEPDKRNTAYSKTITIPGSKNNNTLFNEIFEISGDSLYNPNKKVRCSVIQDGVPIFNGIIQLTTINRIGNGFDNYDELTYDVVILGELASIFSELTDLNLNDLDFSEYTHEYSLVNQENSWNGTIVKNGAPYSNFTAGALRTYTSIQSSNSSTGLRVQLNFSSSHGFSIDDQILISTATGDPLLQGYSTIFSIPSATSVVLNFGWAFLNSFTGTGTAKTWVPIGEGYCYPMVEVGTNLNDPLNWAVQDLYPALYMKSYIDKIFELAGFTYSSTFFDSVFFKRLIVPFNGEKLMFTEDEMNLRMFRAQSVVPQTGTYNMTYPYAGTYTSSGSPSPSAAHQGNSGIQTVTLPNDSTDGGFDNAGVYDNVLYEFTVPSDGVYELVFKATMGVSWPVPVGVGNIFAPSYQASPTSWSRIWFEDELGNILAIQYYVSQSGVAYAATVGTTSDVILNTSQFFEAGKVIKVKNTFMTNARVFTLASGNMTSYTGSLVATWSITDAIFYDIIPQEITDNTSFNPSIIPPSSIKCSDFLLSVIKMFNLYVQPDSTNEKKLFIETRDDFYIDTNPIDWTMKLDTSQDLVLNPMGELQGKRYIYKYKDDSDFLNTRYQDNYPEYNYGEQVILVDNDFIKEDHVTELIFSPTPLGGKGTSDDYYAGFNTDRVLSFIFKEDGGVVSPMSTNLRVLYFAPRGGHFQWQLLSTDGTSYNGRFYPYAGHLDKIEGPAFDLNFGYPYKVYYGYTTWTDNNLYNAYHKKMIDEITDKDSKIVTAFMKLDASDIHLIDFRKLYVIDGHFLRLQKIEGYDINSNGVTKCEFLKVKNGVRFVRTVAVGITVGRDTALNSILLPSYSSPTTIGRNKGSSKGSVLINGIGNRVDPGSSMIKIDGSNNIINSGSTNINISGSNNTVDGGVSNVTIINTNGVHVSESGVVWVNGIKISSEGSIILPTNLIDGGIDIVLDPFNTVVVINYIDAGRDKVLGLGSSSLINWIDAGEDVVLDN